MTFDIKSFSNWKVLRRQMKFLQNRSSVEYSWTTVALVTWNDLPASNACWKLRHRKFIKSYGTFSLTKVEKGKVFKLTNLFIITWYISILFWKENSFNLSKLWVLNSNMRRQHQSKQNRKDISDRRISWELRITFPQNRFTRELHWTIITFDNSPASLEPSKAMS